MAGNTMTDAERARALSGATRECPAYVSEVLNEQQGIPPKQHPTNCYDGCHGTGRVFVLSERARKACPGVRLFEDDVYIETVHNERCCHGDGWLSTLLEEPEPCPGCPDCKLAAWVIVEPYAGCGGSGTIQAWRIGLLIELLEEKGYSVWYATPVWAIGKRVNIGFGEALTGVRRHARLAVAACEALGTNTEVKG